jgi:SAM-dependent methyltransferase
MSDDHSDQPDYSSIVRHYEACLERHGPTHLGVDWPDLDDLRVRYRVMMDVVAAGAEGIPSVLDLGCGPALLIDHLEAIGGLESIRYMGIDISAKMIEAARRRWPTHRFETRDILSNSLADQSFDYVLMNGVLTEKRTLSDGDMTAYAQRLIAAAFAGARKAIAFNVMSTHVDWRRDDLFHWSYDAVAAFLTTQVSRHFIFRADYGLYEYTVYVFRAPQRGA